MNVLKNLKRIVDGFSKRKIQIALAESCTGGYISHMITNIPGASAVFERGIVSYSNKAKSDLLKIESDMFEKNGAVSEQVAKKMAENVRLLSNVDIGVGITGIAGPSGGNEEKPVGLVYMGFSTVEYTLIKRCIFKASRTVFKKKVLKEVLLLLKDYLENFK